MLSQQKIQNFQKEILDWYKLNKRDFPWRRTRDPYRILVSEIMLQQTQVSRVIPKYEEWLKTFPTITSLAKAKTSDVLRLWSGLGYNRRGLYLKKIAEEVVKNHKGKIPSDVEVLQKLPGIGEYTARAIACFAFGKQVAVVDTNIRKVVSLKFFGGKPPAGKELQKIADQLLPKGKAYDWNHALMDYASAMLQKERIPIAKQSKFVGSNRYYRGQIIKLLLKKEKVSVEELSSVLNKDKAFLQVIVTSLVRDGLVRASKKAVFLTNS